MRHEAPRVAAAPQRAAHVAPSTGHGRDHASSITATPPVGGSGPRQRGQRRHAHGRTPARSGINSTPQRRHRIRRLMGADLLGDSDDLTSLDRGWRRQGRDSDGRAPAPPRKRSRSRASDRDGHPRIAHRHSSAGMDESAPHPPLPRRCADRETAQPPTTAVLPAPAPAPPAMPVSGHPAALAPAAAPHLPAARHPRRVVSGTGPPRHHPGPRSDREMRRSQLDLLIGQLLVLIWRLVAGKPWLEERGLGIVTSVTIVTGYQR